MPLLPEKPFDRPPLTIGIDASALVPMTSGGIVNSQAGVLAEAVVRFPHHRYVLFSQATNPPIFADLPASVERVETTADELFAKLQDWNARTPIDVLFRSYPVTTPVPVAFERQIIYIPDIQHEYFPEFFSEKDLAYRRQAFNLALKRAGAIATISEFSRETLTSRAPAGRDIFLMPPALQRRHATASTDELEPAETALLPHGRYFYYPANLWLHKNHRRILRAFVDFAAASDFDYEFILTGDPAGWPALAAEFPDRRIRHLGYVSPTMVSRLYRGATALVFASLFEGFGAPLLEAFAAGTPVVCSDRTSLPEIAGDATLLVDPMDVAGLTAAMRRLAKDAALREDLIARGQKRLLAFDWGRSAESFMAACERVAGRAAPMSGRRANWIAALTARLR